MPGDMGKFRALVLYVADRLRDDELAGATKLNKVLYYADFGHYRSTGEPISGVEYQKLPMGPAPRALLPVRANLIREGAAELVQIEYLGQVQHRLTPRVTVDASGFTRTEVRSVDQAVELLQGKNGTESSDISHLEVGWKMLDLYETIPYETALLRPPVRTAAIAAHGEQLAARLGLLTN